MFLILNERGGGDALHIANPDNIGPATSVDQAPGSILRPDRGQDALMDALIEERYIILITTVYV